MDAQSNSSVLKTPRLCSCCQIWKDISEFYKYPKARKERGDGFMRRCKICVREYNRKQQAKPEQKEKIWVSKLQYRYGITKEEYLNLLKKQKNKCAICEKNLETVNKGKSKTKLAVDHCHTTGTVRGLLCASCNSAIGLLGEDIEIFKKAIEYLKHHSKN